MIKLKRLNVVKLVESEFRAQQLERQGFKRVIEEQLKQESEEIKQLRERAKELGIKGYHNMKFETLQAAIAEKEEIELASGRDDGEQNQGEGGE